MVALSGIPCIMHTMTTDDHIHDLTGMLTLTEAAARTGHTREALRQRIRRGSLPSTKGNDGQLRIAVRDLGDLAPPNATGDDHGQEDDAATDAALAILVASVADLRADLVRTRSALDTAQADRLADRGRAERAEAVASAEAARAALAESRVAAAEAALAEARTPWAVRVITAWRTRGGAA